MTSKFEITNTVSGQSLGEYEGADECDAIDAMAVDAGYRDYHDMTESVGGDISELSTVEVER